MKRIYFHHSGPKLTQLYLKLRKRKKAEKEDCGFNFIFINKIIYVIFKRKIVTIFNLRSIKIEEHCNVYALFMVS